MTLIDYEELCAYWANYPPVHLSVAAYLGIGRRPSSRPHGATRGQPRAAAAPSTNSGPPSTNSGLRELLGASGFARGNLHDGCAEAVIFDFDAMVARAKARKTAAAG